MQPYLIAIIVVVAVLALLLLFAAVTYKFAFGRRCDKNPRLKYFTAQDFNLSAESVSLPNGLNGFLYRSQAEGNDNLVIFCHGMGPGHIAYTTEIAYFCNLGYAVLALDNRGCNLSKGKSVVGLYSGAKSVISAIDYAKSNYSYKKIYLVGHSWGAYSALCASAKRKVNAVVAISAPASPSKCMQNGVAPILSKPFAALMRPFWWTVGLLRLGVNGNCNAAKSASKNHTPTLIVHGENDRVVLPSNSAYYNAKGKNITKLLVKDRCHNPYNTVNAEKCLAEIPAKLKSGEDMENFDFKAATEEDPEVMQKIAAFIENN